MCPIICSSIPVKVSVCRFLHGALSSHSGFYTEPNVSLTLFLLRKLARYAHSFLLEHRTDMQRYAIFVLSVIVYVNWLSSLPEEKSVALVNQADNAPPDPVSISSNQLFIFIVFFCIGLSAFVVFLVWVRRKCRSGRHSVPLSL